MGACQIRPRHAKRHYVLKLITETVCAACLVESCPSPDAASESLIEQPAVQQNVERAIRGLHLHGAENGIPSLRDFCQHGVEVGFAVFCEQRLRVGPGCRLAEKENDFTCAISAEEDRRLQRGAGIESRADPARERRRRGQGQRPVERSVATDEFHPVGGPGCLPVVEICESDTLAELIVPRIPCKYSTGFRIHLGHDKRRCRTAAGTEHPFHISSDGEAARAAGMIDNLQPRNLDWVSYRHVLEQLKRYAVRVMLESAVALSVARHIGRILLAFRKRRGAPYLAA